MAKSLTKAEIAKQLAEKWNCTTKEAENQFEDVLEVMAQGLLRGERVYMDDFGSLTPRQKGPSSRTVPGKGRIEIPAHIVVKFAAFGPLETRLKKQFFGLQ